MISKEFSNGRARGIEPSSISEVQRFPTPATFGEYYEQLLEGRNDPQNAADRVLHALINPDKHKVEDSPNGPIYHVFDERTDGLDVYGMHEAKRALVEALKLSSQTGGAENIIMLVLPSGAGKSTMLEIVKRELIRESREHPLLAIEGCPTRETPDHLLTDDERKKLYESTGRAVHGELCSHCQAKLDEYNGDRNHMSIKSVRLTENAGISELDPRLTKPGDWRTQEYLADVALRAAGGLLRIPEFVKQGKVAHEGLMDFYRGVPERKITDPEDGKIHRVDCLVIGDTTVQEFEAFFDSDNDYLEPEAMQALKDRMLVVKAPHNLSISQEVRIYEKMLRAGNFLGNVHASPKLLESLAEIAIQTRLLDSKKFNALTREAKVRLYDGKDVEGFERNTTNINTLQDESREHDEGLEGISPPFVRREVLLPLFSQALACGYDNPYTGATEKGCVTPLEAFRNIYAAIEDAEYELGYVHGSDYEKIIERVQEKYDKWLIETVINSFNKRYNETVSTRFADYIEIVGRLLDKEEDIPDALNTTKEPLAAARRRAEDLENFIFGIVPEEEQRADFRKIFDREITKLIVQHRESGDPDFEAGKEPDLRSLFTEDNPGVNVVKVIKGIKDQLTTENAQKGFHAVSGEQFLRGLASGSTLQTEQVERLFEARMNLIEDSGFCPCCVEKLMQYAAGKLSKLTHKNADVVRRALGMQAKLF